MKDKLSVKRKRMIERVFILVHLLIRVAFGPPTLKSLFTKITKTKVAQRSSLRLPCSR
jgi:hypothetical protein